MAKEEDLFNPAFKDLDLKIKQSQEAERESERPPMDEGKPDDGQAFLEAMSDVTPLPENKRKIVPTPGNHIRQGSHI